MKAATPKNIDEYIKMFPEDIQERLEQMRATIQKAAPKAVEVISYGMPAFKQNKVLVYFAAFKNHIGYYPTSSITTIFKEELADYKTAKGSIQFPYSKKLPLGLVAKIAKYRAKEDLLK